MGTASPPLPLVGLRSALSLWKLAVVVWLLPVATVLPAVVVLDLEVGSHLEEMTSCPAAAGDALLIAVRAVLGAARPLLLALAGGALALWVGTVLWHAGTVSWYGTGGGGPFRLAEMLARGALRFWVYARLSAIALLALVSGLTLLLVPLGWVAGRAREAMAEGPMVVLLGLAVALGILWSVVVWSATLHGAWRVGFDPRRSALRAWFGGLQETWRRPLPNLGTVVVAAAAGALLALAPVILGAVATPLRGGAAGMAVAAIAGAARAVVWVALFLAFAPGEPPPLLAPAPPEPAGDEQAG